MNKLKKKMLTIYLQRVRSPNGMTLKEYTNFYADLVSKYGDSKTLKVISRSGYYGGYWLIDRRLETSAELVKRQAILDKNIAKKEALRAKIKASREIEAKRRQAQQKIDTIKYRKSVQRHKKAMKKAQLEKKVEEVKTMVKALELAGFKVTSTKGISTRS